MPASTFCVAAVQTVSGGDVAANLEQIEPLIAQAADAGAKLVLLPEYFGLMGMRATDKLAAAERDGQGPQQDFMARIAQRHSVYVVGGCVPMLSADPARVRSACLVYDPQGERVARYDKIHLFAFSDGAERYDEAQTIDPGDRAVAFESPWGRIALSICYDVRFPELYRSLGDLTLILVPAAFTVPTGKAHWSLLLRARAVENLCHLVASAQVGEHENGRRTYGHSAVIDCWGAELAALPTGEGIAVGEIDLERQARVRSEFPALEHRVLGRTVD